MLDKVQERRMLLLFVLFSLTLCLGGCGRRGGEVYMAGLETELPAGPETECQDGESPDTGDPGAGEENGSDSREENETESSQTAGYVYVCGAVRHPGVYPMHSGMRVFEAVELAGGFAEDADEDWLNQAGHLQDGQQLYICTKDETQQMQEAGSAVRQGTAGSTGSMMQPGTAGDAGALAQQGAVPGGGVTAQEASGVTGGKVNLNTADVGTLMTLPGIGEVKAEAIVRYRTEHGAFSSIEEIQNIPGIKQAVFSKIADQITV